MMSSDDTATETAAETAAEMHKCVAVKSPLGAQTVLGDRHDTDNRGYFFASSGRLAPGGGKGGVSPSTISHRRRRSSESSRRSKRSG